MRYGVSRAFGKKLHRFVTKGTRNRLMAFLSGGVLTLFLQSSTAMALIVSGFCAQGLLNAAAGIAMILGADVGTSIVAQLLSFDLSWLSPLFIIAGFILYSGYEKAGRWGHIGKFLFGLGLMLLALGLIKSASAPLKESELLPLILHSLEKDVVFSLLLVVLLTWLVHSSLAVVLLLISFVSAGVLPVEEGLAMVLGANMGAVIAPMVSTMKDSVAARWVPLGNAFIRSTGVLLCLPFVGIAHGYLARISPDPAQMIVTFHVLFNVTLALLFLPFTPFVARLCRIFLPRHAERETPGTPKYLDESALDTPAVALAGAARETLRIADIVEIMLEETMMALRHDDRRLVQKIREQDDVVDQLYRAIKMYMARMSQEQLDPDEGMRYVQILAFSTNLENGGDMIDKSLMQMVLKKIREHKRFSDQGWKEIQGVHQFVIESVRLAQNVFVSEDVELARRLVERKDELRRIEARLTTSHFERIREGVVETIATSSLHLDIIRDYRRINSYMCSVAYPILEEKGLLHETRLRSVKE